MQLDLKDHNHNVLADPTKPTLSFNAVRLGVEKRLLQAAVGHDRNELLAIAKTDESKYP